MSHWGIFVSNHSFVNMLILFKGFPGGSDSKESACSAGDAGSIPGSGRSHGGGCGNALQYSCLENPMDRGVWWATSPWELQRVGHNWATKHACYPVGGLFSIFFHWLTIAFAWVKRWTFMLFHWINLQQPSSRHTKGSSQYMCTRIGKGKRFPTPFKSTCKWLHFSVNQKMAF